MASSGNGHLQHQCNGSTGGPIEMEPILKPETQPSLKPTVAKGSIKSNCSTNISRNSKESSPGPQRPLVEQKTSNSYPNDASTLAMDTTPSISIQNCDSKLFYSKPLTPTVKCFTNCCGSDMDLTEVQKQNDTKLTKLHYKVLTVFLGTCLIGLLCFILVIFLSPHLFFQSQG